MDFRNKSRLVAKLNENVALSDQQGAAYYASFIELVQFVAVFCRRRTLGSDFVEAARNCSEFFVSFVHFGAIEPRDHVCILHAFKLIAFFRRKGSKPLMQS